jgi:iron complex outermembrane receptor protein
VQHDGYLQNVNPGVGNPDAANRTAVRGQIRWEPTDAIVNTLHADYLYTHEQWATNDTFLSPTIGITWAGGDPLLQSINGQLDKVDVVTVPYQTELSYGVTDDFSWKLNDFLTLKSITAVRTDHSVNYQDGLSDVYFQGGYSAYDEQQDSQEFNLVNNVGPLSGVAGLYYFNDAVRQIGVSLNYGGNLKVPNPAGGTETYQLTYIPIISRAAFFEETYHFTPELSVTVGARYTQDHKTLNTFNETVKIPAGFPQNNTYFVQGVYTTLAPPSLNPYIADLNQNENATTPKIAINWQATPGALLYLSATNGFKSGGFSNTARATLGAAFGPEHIWAYELGAKTDWFDHSLRINVALFHYIWAGQQFNALIEPQLSVTTNAGGSTLNGLEANIISKPIKGLTLTANAVLLSTKYTDFPSYTFPGAFKSLLVGDPNYNVAAGTYNATGKQLVDAPNVSLNFTGQKDFDLPGGADFFVRAEYDYVSKMYLDPTNVAIATRPDVNLINASIGYSPAGAHWTVSLWAKNLENNIYINGIAAGSTITAPVTDPRTFGIRINYNY